MYRHLTAGQRRQTQVIYRTGAGMMAREWFRSVGAALERAEFIQRVECVPVFIRHGQRGRAVRCVS